MSFGMLMPSRNSQSNLQGGFSNGTTTVNGNTYVSNLTVTTRIGNTPNTYKAATSIEFVGEYTDNGNEEYEAFIVNQTNPDPNPTTGTVSNGNDERYRYGFNGKENDKDAGEGIQDYGMRIYDSRIGKFLSVDPLTKEYPWNSTYAFAENDVMRSIDLDGLEKYIVTNSINKSGFIYNRTITTVTNKNTNKLVNMQMVRSNGQTVVSNVFVRNISDDGNISHKFKNSLNSTEKGVLRNGADTKFEDNTAKDEKRYIQTNGAPNSSTEMAAFDKSVSLNDFPQSEFAAKVVSLNFTQLKQNSFKYSNGIFCYLGTTDIVGGNTKNGTLDLNLFGADELKGLPAKIKADGSVTAITIKIVMNLSPENSDEAFKSFKKGVEYAGEQYKEHLKKSGVDNVNVIINCQKSSEKNGGVSIDLKRN
jgi:RHS repeat-associated protein